MKNQLCFRCQQEKDIPLLKIGIVIEIQDGLLKSQKNITQIVTHKGVCFDTLIGKLKKIG